MLYEIHNDILAVAISTKGAELQSIIHKENGIEYLWSGDAKFWGKKSPVLFPIVGGLKNNNYTYQDKTYHLSRHGFARDMEFEVTNQSEETITFTLTDNEETLKNYPFHFRFSLCYTLRENKMSVEYIVENTGAEKMYFSVGGHPAFKLPLTEEAVFEDYFLQFSAVENAGRWLLSGDGLIENSSIVLLNNTTVLPLKKSLFYKDALVFKHLHSNAVSIKSNKTPHGLTVYFGGFSYFGIWNAKDADFVCLEPWCGIADSVNASGILNKKEGINQLAAKEKFVRSWQVKLF